jgi:aromatic ring-opening dioxygenase catalytic subunit (LigB family)
VVDLLLQHIWNKLVFAKSRAVGWHKVSAPDYYLPLLYVIGTRTQSEPVTFFVEGVDGGSISMLTVQVGTALSGV